MFMHFSCIHTNFVYIILILNCLVLFCLPLSLSLSFSLSLVSCSMAPKRIFTPFRNPLYFGVSSSDSTPSHVRFYDKKARTNFSENFSYRGIHSKRQVVLSNFFDTNLPIVIYSRGWESLCGIPVTSPSIIIQEFYSNMHRFDYFVPHFITRV